jgi:hypothetical protein
MRFIDGRILLSASDLMRFTGCSHATTLDLAYLEGLLRNGLIHLTNQRHLIFRLCAVASRQKH